MPTNNVDFSVRAQTRQAEAALRRLTGTGRGLVQWTRNLRAGLMGMNTMMIGAGAVMVGAGSALRSAARSTEEYSNAQANLRSVLVSSNISVREQQNLMRVADVSATRYGIGLAETSRAMVDMAEAGFNTHEVMRYFPIATEFATAANMNLADAVNMLQGSMHQFNLQSEEEARQMAGGLLVAARISSTSVEELQNAFRYAAVEAAGLGYNATEVTGALAGLSIMNLRGSIAGTRLRAVLAGLNRITQRTEQVARESGISVERLHNILYDAAGNTLPLRDAFRNLMVLFAELPNRMEQNRLAVSMFGRYGMSAGMMFANLNGQAAQWEGILDRISDRQYVANTMTQAATENMRGFGAQMRLARTAMENFGIGFGEILLGLDNTEEGFGQYLSNLSAAVRLADESARRNGQARQQWEAMTPELRSQATAIREAMTGWAEFLIILGRAAGYVADWVGHNPRLAAGLLLVGSALRPIMAQLIVMPRVWLGVAGAARAATGSLLGFNAATATTTTALGAFAGAFVAVLAAYAALTAIDEFRDRIIEQNQMVREYNRALNEGQSALDSWGLGWATQIPILGRVIQNYATLISLTNQLVEVNDTLEAQRRTQRERELAGASQRVAARAASMQRAYGGRLSEEEAMARGGRAEMTDLMQSMVAFQRTRFTSSEGAFADYSRMMRESGLTPNEAAAQQEQFMRLWRSTNIESAQLEVQRQRNLGNSATDLATAFGELSQYMRDMTGPSMPANMPAVPAVQDAYVRRGGIVSVADDDLIVARSELARVLSMAPGGAIPSPSPQQVGATPQSQQPAQMNTSVNFEVPVYLDGREIARAIGTQNLQTDQRRGTRTAPGSRRRVTQSGVR